ncbi:MAG: hypothetical protein LBD98_03235 [Endomicrobium sp.]|nr:hypothetical protein [Endomicrobium sp.]
MIRHILAGSLHRSVLQSSGLADIAGIRSRVQSRVQKERPIEKSILAAAGGAIVHPSRIAQPGSRIGRYANPPDHQVTAYSSGSTNKNFNKILTFPSTPKHPPVFGKQMEELGTAHANQDARRDDTIKRQEVYANRP